MSSKAHVLHVPPHHSGAFLWHSGIYSSSHCVIPVLAGAHGAVLCLLFCPSLVFTQCDVVNVFPCQSIWIYLIVKEDTWMSQNICDHPPVNRYILCFPVFCHYKPCCSEQACIYILILILIAVFLTYHADVP